MTFWPDLGLGPDPCLIISTFRPDGVVNESAALAVVTIRNGSIAAKRIRLVSIVFSKTGLLLIITIMLADVLPVGSLRVQK